MSRLNLPIVRDDTDLVEKGKDVSWFLQILEPLGLVLCFSDNEKWLVKDRIDFNKVEAIEIGKTRVRVVRFDGPFDAAETALRGGNLDTFIKFAKGFPEDWKLAFPRPPPPPPDPLRRSTRHTQNDDEEKRGESDEEGLPLLRRSKRTKVVERENDHSFYDEDEMLLRALRKEEEKDQLVNVLGLYEEDMTDDEDDEECDPASKWSPEEIEAFHQARMMLNPMSGTFWEQMSKDFVKTRSSLECQLRWVFESSAVDSKERRARKGEDDDNEFSEENAMKKTQRAAKMGTAKFRKQVRNEWERVHVKQQRDNLATPFRAKMTMDHLPDAHFSDIKTPAAAFVFGDRQKKRRLGAVREEESSDVEEKQEEEAPSPDVLVHVNRDNLDDYLVGLVKEKKKIQNFQAKNTKRRPNVKGESRLESITNGLVSEVEAGGVSGTMTPGGTVRLTLGDAMRDSLIEEKQDDEDDRDSVW